MLQAPATCWIVMSAGLHAQPQQNFGGRARDRTGRGEQAARGQDQGSQREGDVGTARRPLPHLLAGAVREPPASRRACQCLAQELGTSCASSAATCGMPGSSPRLIVDRSTPYSTTGAACGTVSRSTAKVTSTQSVNTSSRGCPAPSGAQPVPAAALPQLRLPPRLPRPGLLGYHAAEVVAGDPGEGRMAQAVRAHDRLDTSS